MLGAVLGRRILAVDLIQSLLDVVTGLHTRESRRYVRSSMSPASAASRSITRSATKCPSVVDAAMPLASRYSPYQTQLRSRAPQWLVATQGNPEGAACTWPWWPDSSRPERRPIWHQADPLQVSWLGLRARQSYWHSCPDRVILARGYRLIQTRIDAARPLAGTLCEWSRTRPPHRFTSTRVVTINRTGAVRPTPTRHHSQPDFA